jgi:hypothetical protein
MPKMVSDVHYDIVAQEPMRVAREARADSLALGMKVGGELSFFEKYALSSATTMTHRSILALSLGKEHVRSHTRRVTCCCPELSTRS